MICFSVLFGRIALPFPADKGEAKGAGDQVALGVLGEAALLRGLGRCELRQVLHLSRILQALPLFDLFRRAQQQEVGVHFSILAWATRPDLTLTEPCFIQRLHEQLCSLAGQRGRCGLFPGL